MKRFIAAIILSLLLILPAMSMAAELPEDGEYSIEAVLTGGSGRAGVESPALLRVEKGVCTLVVVWSSPYYEYMSIDGVRYEPIQEEGNATFEIPVTLDEDIPVAALTVAMSEPHEIEYTLRLDSATIKPVDSGAIWPYAAAIVSAAAAAVVVLAYRRQRKAK